MREVILACGVVLVAGGVVLATTAIRQIRQTRPKRKASK